MSLLSGTRSRALGDWTGLVLGALALWLRLLTPAPLIAPVDPASPAADLVALFGEHALCVAAALGDKPASPDRHPAPSHEDCLGCCNWQLAIAVALPPAGTVSAPGWIEAAFIAAFPPADLPPSRATGPLGARAPPLQA